MTEHRPWARLEVVKGEAEAVAVAGDGVELAGGALRIFRDDEGVVFVKAASKGVKVRGKEVGEEMTALVDDGDRIKVTGTAWEDGPVEYVVELVESDDGDVEMTPLARETEAQIAVSGAAYMNFDAASSSSYVDEAEAKPAPPPPRRAPPARLRRRDESFSSSSGGPPPSSDDGESGSSGYSSPPGSASSSGPPPPI